MTLRWPYTLPPISRSFRPSSQSRSPGQSLSGLEQVVQSDAGRWQARFQVPVSKSRIRALRAIQALQSGRAGEILVPVYGWANSPAAVSGRSRLGPIPHSDGSYFSDGSGYSQADITVSLTASAAYNASSVNMMMAAPDYPEAGQFFSLGEFLYLIKSAVLVSGTTWTVNIWPNLREAALSGDVPNFTDPVCRMRFMSDDTGDLELSYKTGTANFEFVEAI